MMPRLIPTRIDLIREFPNSVGVEVGVCRGHFTSQILNEAHVRKLYGIDAWDGDTPGEPSISAAEHQERWAEANENTRGFGSRVLLLRGRSPQAAKPFIDTFGLVDWVYIDAAHDYNSVMKDLRAWSEALKPGGSILGHDYTTQGNAEKFGFGVVQAVDDFCRQTDWKLTALTNEEYPSFRLDRQ